MLNEIKWLLRIQNTIIAIALFFPMSGEARVFWLVVLTAGIVWLWRYEKQIKVKKDEKEIHS